jgi:hypothetical protein
VNLDDMLDRCCGLETRTAALYRSFAAAAREQPDLCALWTATARVFRRSGEDSADNANIGPLPLPPICRRVSQAAALP